MTALTEGHLLGGRVRHAQPATGFRSGIEPVLLAASIPARTGERVVEGGTGSGAALLCLAARVPGVTGWGIDLDPAMAALAAANATTNGFADLRIIAGDIAHDLPADRFDHAFANPPYHAAGGTESPDTARERAKRAPAGLLRLWAAALGACLRRRGTLTFVLPAGSLPPCLEAMAAAGCPAEAILPLWPKSGMAAKLVIVRGVKGGRAALRLLPGIVLHRPDGAYSAAAEAILREGACLSFTGR